MPAFETSAEGRAFVADPANWDRRAEGPVDVPLWRRESQALADAAAPGILQRRGVTAQECEVAGLRCLEVLPPKAVGNSTILYFFGGGFCMGGPWQDLEITAALAAKTGLRVLSPWYRLAPEHPWPAGPEDAIRITNHIAQEGSFMIAGESAGGAMALLATQRLIADGSPLPTAMALLSPGCDLSDTFDRDAAPDDPMLNPASGRLMVGMYLGGSDPADPRVSPLYGSFGPSWPPSLITTGTRDRLLGPCTRLARAIRSSGSQADLRVWDGMWHVFECYPGIPEAEASLFEIADFLNAAKDDV